MRPIVRKIRVCWIPAVFLLGTAACYFPTGTPAETAAAVTATPSLPQPGDTATPTLEPTPEPTTEPTPTVTNTPVPPTATATLAAATPTVDITAWLNIIGTWSGCVSSASAGVPSVAAACSAPSGMFVTLYVQANCLIGQHCGNLVTGGFESEFVLLRLTFQGILGTKVWMHGTSSSPIYASSNTDLSIERVGSKVRVTETAGQQLIFLLPPGCDPVIQASTTTHCSEHIP